MMALTQAEDHHCTVPSAVAGYATKAKAMTLPHTT